MRFDQNGWLDVAAEIDYLSKSEDRQGNSIKYLILHGTAGGTSAQAIANYFASSSEQASAHFIIGVDGTIVQGIPLSLAAWANGPIDGTPADNLGFRTESDGVHRDSWWNPDLNPNYITASIEHCKAHDDNSDALTPAQQSASFELIKTICDTYDIPKRFADENGGITGHFSMSAINRQRCPGNYPWDALWTYLQGNNPKPAPPKPNQNQLKAAGDCWASFFHTIGQTTPTIGTGIYHAWLDAYCSGIFYGPPITREYPSIDWNGNTITVQEFAHARCEWSSGVATWYPLK